MRPLFQHPSDFELIIKLLEVIIWPLIFFFIMAMFRKQIAQIIDRLGSLKADSTGVSLVFEKKLAEAKQLVAKIQPKATADIVVSSDTQDLPYHQLITLRAQLEHQLHDLAQNNHIDNSNSSSFDILEKLKETGALNIKNAKAIHVLVDLINAADATTTQRQVNEVKALLNKIQLD